MKNKAFGRWAYDIYSLTLHSFSSVSTSVTSMARREDLVLLDARHGLLGRALLGMDSDHRLGSTPGRLAGLTSTLKDVLKQAPRHPEPRDGPWGISHTSSDPCSLSCNDMLGHLHTSLHFPCKYSTPWLDIGLIRDSNQKKKKK